MTKSLLGPYIQRVPSVQEMRDWLFEVRPNVVLTMENSTCAAILGNRPHDWNPTVIGRKPMGQELGDPKGVARSIIDSQWKELCQEGIVSHMMLKNEINPHDGRWREYVSWEREALNELSWAGIRYAAGSWSVGNPDELYGSDKRMVYYDAPEVHTLMREVAQTDGLLKLHNYNAPSMADLRDFDPPVTDIWDPTINSSWRALRHRKAYLQLRDFLEDVDIPRFVIGECGLEAGAVPWPIDGVDQGQLAGWKTMQTAEQYMEGLQWLDWQCRHDPYVVGLVVFIMGTYPRQSDGSEGHWVTHDVWPIRGRFGRAILNPLPIEEEPPPPPPPPPLPDKLEEWIVNEVAEGWANELPFVPDNFIEALGLRMRWVPVSDERIFYPPEEVSDEEGIRVKIFMAPALKGGYFKLIVWWKHGDWENYKIIPMPN